MAKIRVLLADDYPEMIQTVRQALDDGFEIVDAVEDGKKAVPWWLGPLVSPQAMPS